MDQETVKGVLDASGIRYEHNGVAAEFSGVSTLDAPQEGTLCWIREPWYDVSRLCCAVLVAPSDFASQSEGMAVFRVPNPRLAFIALMQELFAPQVVPGVHPTADVHPEVELGRGVFVGRNATISRGCKVGDGCRIEANAVIYEDCVLGRRVRVGAGCVIGAEGFGFERDKEGRWNRFPQVGNVVLEDDVEVGPNTCIDRGTLGSTRVGRGTKISNLVQVAHNAQIGEDCLLTGGVQVAGSAHIGDGAHIGPRSVILNKVKVGKKTQVRIASVVVKDVPDGQTVSGHFAMPHREALYLHAMLDKMLQDLRNKGGGDVDSDS
jgi:UDP-3-O-[3-hydroxymyristoyl] glucosamine N-acyltransferase